MAAQTDKQAIAAWSDYIKAFLDDVSVESDESPSDKARRIKHLEGETTLWFTYYFEKYCKSEFAPFHLRATRRMIEHTRWYEVRAWSRELAKSALSMFEIIYLALTGRVKNVLLISNSYDNAERLLLPFMLNFEKNLRIISDYGVQVTPGQWESGEFTARCGCSFRAVGAGQSPRGTRNENVRPDLILIDDIDTDEECRNPERLKEKWKWVEGALIPTLSVSGNIRILFNGNLISSNGCIARAMEMADHVDVVNIRDKNGKSSWTQKNSEEDIDYILSKISYAAGQKEYFNNPISEGDTFKELTWGKCPPLSRFRFLVAYSDPATSNKDNKSSCTKAVILLGFVDGKYYVLNAFVDNATNDTFVQWFYDLRDWVGGRSTVYYYIENNSLQNPFYEQVFLPMFNARGRKDGNSIGVTPDKRNKGDKYTRIEGTLEPLIRTGQLVFNEAEKGNPHMKRLSDQFLCVTPKLTAPCDGVDATEGGVFVIREKMSNGSSCQTLIPRTKNHKRY